MRRVVVVAAAAAAAAAASCLQMEERIWDTVESQGRDLRKVLQHLDAESKQQTATSRRGAVNQMQILDSLKSKGMAKLVHRFEKETHQRKRSAKMSVMYRKSSRVAV